MIVDEFMMIVRALSDQSRVRAVLALRDRQLCVCQIMGLLGFAPSTVSKHMTILKQAGLVRSRKEGRWVYYRLPGPDAPAAAREAIKWLVGSLAQTRQICRDAERLEAIVRLDPAILCRSSSHQGRKENE